MEKIGDFEYPVLASFADAISITNEALKRGGIISIKDTAEKLGYAIKQGQAVSGTIYKRLDDLCMFGLLKRERGGLRATNLGQDALHPHDKLKASTGKAAALRKIPIINKAYNELNGKIPEREAFSANLEKLTSVSWLEAQKHAQSLRKLFIEAFSYLRSAEGLPPLVQVGESEARGEIKMPEVSAPLESSSFDIRAGEIFIRIPKTKKALIKARKLLDLFEDEIEDKELQKEKKQLK